MFALTIGLIARFIEFIIFTFFILLLIICIFVLNVSVIFKIYIASCILAWIMWAIVFVMKGIKEQSEGSDEK